MSPCGSSRRGLRLGRGGTAAVEFAISASSLILLLLGIIEFSRYFFSVQSVSYIAGEAARLGTFSTASGCSSQVARLAPKAPILRADGLTLQLCVYPPGTGGNATTLTQLSVAAGYDFAFVVPFLTRRTIRISESIAMSFVGPAP